MCETYFVKPGYKLNLISSTMDHVSGGTYWDRERIRAAYYYQYHVYSYVSALIRKVNAGSLVDLGCGVGPKLAYLKKLFPDLDITGVDQESAIQYCKKAYNFGKWLADDFENPVEGLVPKSPDIIVSADVIEHLEKPDHLLSYIRNLAGPTTYIVISTPERDRMRGKNCEHCPNPQHVREWNKQEFSAYVRSRGFEIIEHLCVPAFKMNLRVAFVKQEVRRLSMWRPRRNNQVTLIRSRGV